MDTSVRMCAVADGGGRKPGRQLARACELRDAVSGRASECGSVEGALAGHGRSGARPFFAGAVRDPRVADAGSGGGIVVHNSCGTRGSAGWVFGRTLGKIGDGRSGLVPVAAVAVPTVDDSGGAAFECVGVYVGNSNVFFAWHFGMGGVGACV